MISGSTRYARSLGFVGGLGAESAAEAERTWTEKTFGVEVTGKPVFAGGSGLTIGATPSTILFSVFIGTMIAVANTKVNGIGSSTISGGVLGALGGFVVISMIKGAGKMGI